MFNQIRKIIEKIKGEDIFCSSKDEKYILKELKDKDDITPLILSRLIKKE